MAIHLKAIIRHSNETNKPSPKTNHPSMDLLACHGLITNLPFTDFFSKRTHLTSPYRAHSPRIQDQQGSGIKSERPSPLPPPLIDDVVETMFGLMVWVRVYTESLTSNEGTIGSIRLATCIHSSAPLTRASRQTDSRNREIE